MYFSSIVSPQLSLPAKPAQTRFTGKSDDSSEPDWLRQLEEKHGRRSFREPFIQDMLPSLLPKQGNPSATPEELKAELERVSGLIADGKQSVSTRSRDNMFAPTHTLTQNADGTYRLTSQDLLSLRIYDLAADGTLTAAQHYSVPFSKPDSSFREKYISDEHEKRAQTFQDYPQKDLYRTDDDFNTYPTRPQTPYYKLMNPPSFNVARGQALQALKSMTAATRGLQILY